MRCHRLALMTVVATLALSSCTSTPESEPDQTPMELVAFEAGGSGLRGVLADRRYCPEGPDQVHVEATVLVPDPTELLVCSLHGGPVGGPPTLVRMQPGDPSFERLVVALSHRDRQGFADRPCIEVEEVAAVLYAQTADDLFRLAIPVDGCGYYQLRAKRAIRAVTG